RADTLPERSDAHPRSPGPLGPGHDAAAAARLRGQGPADRPALPDGRGARRASHDRQRESPGRHARVQHHRLHVYLSRPGAGGARSGRAPAHGVLGRDGPGGRDGTAGLELPVAGQAAALPAVLALFRQAPSAPAHPRLLYFPTVMSDETEWVEGMGGEPEEEVRRLREALEAKAREAEAQQDRALRAMAELDNAK